MLFYYAKNIDSADQIVPAITETERVLPILHYFDKDPLYNLRFSPSIVKTYQNKEKALSLSTQAFLDFLLIFGANRNTLKNHFEDLDKLFSNIKNYTEQFKKSFFNKNKKKIKAIEAKINQELLSGQYNICHLIQQYEIFTGNNLAFLFLKKILLEKMGIPALVLDKNNNYYLGIRHGNRILLPQNNNSSIYSDELHEQFQTLEIINIYIELCRSQAKEFLALGDLDSAIDYYKTALIFDEENPLTNYELGKIYTNKDFTLAKKHLLIALKSQDLSLPHKAEIYYILGEGKALRKLLSENEELIQEKYYKLMADSYYFFKNPNDYHNSIKFYELAIKYYISRFSNKQLSFAEINDLINIFIRLRSIYLRKTLPLYNLEKAKKCQENIVFFSTAKKAR